MSNTSTRRVQYSRLYDVLSSPRVSATSTRKYSFVFIRYDTLYLHTLESLTRATENKNKRNKKHNAQKKRSGQESVESVLKEE